MLRPKLGMLVLETPISPMSLPIRGAGIVTLLLALAEPVCAKDLLASIEPSKRQHAETFLEVCHTNGIVTRVTDGHTDEEKGALASWEFHDLLFHVSSRIGRSPRVGATFRLRERISEEPPIRSRYRKEKAIPLPVPDLQRLKQCDITLTRALETRRSRYGIAPVDFQTISEFLYRTCRVTGRSKVTGNSFVVQKLYPSGGSLHPLEIYMMVSGCDGLDQGLYYYRGWEHALVKLRPMDDEVRMLLEDAKRSAAHLPADPPILFIMTARFRRTAWKYESIAYRLILTEVGTLYQTMYLVATAMGLSACALGAGDSDRFARISGSNYYEETSVGEFILGRQ